MKQAWIVVDYQNDFVDGALGFPGAEKLEEPICRTIENARQQGGQIIFTFDTHEENYKETKEGQKLPIVHCLDGTTGWALYGKVAEAMREGDLMVCKPSFGSAELLDYLRLEQFDQVFLMGLVSYICVISNAVLAKAALPEAEIVVDAKLTAGPDPIQHQKALDILEGLQITILNREEEVR